MGHQRDLPPETQGSPLEETWGLLFDPAKQLGSFHLLEDIRLCAGAALHYKGYRINSTNLKELAETRDLLVETKRRSLGFATSFAGKNRVLAKDAVATIAYSNDAARGLAEDSDTTYFIPKEGGGLWLDNLSIPAKAPHPDLAEKFINHVLEAKASARIATFTRTATPNKAALEFIPSEDRRNSAIYPPPEVMARLEYGYDLGANNKLYEELWTQIKAR